MTNDKYTKVILTISALCLIALVYEVNQIIVINDESRKSLSSLKELSVLNRGERKDAADLEDMTPCNRACYEKFPTPLGLTGPERARTRPQSKLLHECILACI